MREVHHRFFVFSQHLPHVYPESDGFLETYGSVTAQPSVTEKGYIDIRLTVSSPGGHSSIPPKHTVEFLIQSPLKVMLTQYLVQSIGLLATMITELEASPIPVKLSRGSVHNLACSSPG